MSDKLKALPASHTHLGGPRGAIGLSGRASGGARGRRLEEGGEAGLELMGSDHGDYTANGGANGNKLTAKLTARGGASRIIARLGQGNKAAAKEPRHNTPRHVTREEGRAEAFQGKRTTARDEG